MTRAAIAVLTFHREASLARALASIAGQDPLPDLDVRVVVVDNSPTGTARPVTTAAARTFPMSLDYVHEPTPGIVPARNAAVRACGSDELLVFLDDDEEASPAWLRHLVQTQAATGADAVAGPVLSEYQVEPPAWLVAGGHLDRPRRPTGTRLDRCGAGNLLLTPRARQRLGADPFDERFSLTGGEDSFLTQQLVRAGGALVWSDEAVAVEHVGPERCRPRWVFRRAFRTAGSSARARLLLAPSPQERARVRIRCVVGGGVKAAAGAVLLLLSPVLGSRWPWHRAVRLACVGAGLSSGALGHVAAEYRRTG